MPCEIQLYCFLSTLSFHYVFYLISVLTALTLRNSETNIIIMYIIFCSDQYIGEYMSFKLCFSSLHLSTLEYTNYKKNLRLIGHFK